MAVVAAVAPTTSYSICNFFGYVLQQEQTRTAAMDDICSDEDGNFVGLGPTHSERRCDLAGWQIHRRMFAFIGFCGS